MLRCGGWYCVWWVCDICVICVFVRCGDGKDYVM